MKRSPALRALSRDHHAALAVALRLRRAKAADVGDALAGFHEYFDSRGEHHFAVEEAVLLPAVARLDDGATLGARVMREHETVRRLAADTVDAGTSPQGAVDLARSLGEALEAHVRFEERELFPWLERGLPADELAHLAEQLAAA